MLGATFGTGMFLKPSRTTRVDARVVVARGRRLAGVSGRESVGPAVSVVRDDAKRGPRYVPLARRLALINSVVVVMASVLTLVVLAPHRLGSVAWEEALILAVTLVVLAGLNLLAVRRSLAPLVALTTLTRSIDSARPAELLVLSGAESEVTEMAAAFNDMLERLEREQDERSGSILAAQESERLRVARELHDEVGQTLTALLLQLSQAARDAPPGLAGTLIEAQETARASLDDVRRIALELRPEGLDDLGLPSALETLCDRLEKRVGLRVVRRVARRLPELSGDAELVVYRVAQEALTNVVRHSGSSTALLELTASPGGVSLVVSDEGHGLSAEANSGSGVRGMRERASLVGATLSLHSVEGSGVTVRLDVPIAPGSA